LLLSEIWLIEVLSNPNLAAPTKDLSLSVPLKPKSRQSAESFALEDASQTQISLLQLKICPWAYLSNPNLPSPLKDLSKRTTLTTLTPHINPSQTSKNVEKFFEKIYTPHKFIYPILFCNARKKRAKNHKKHWFDAFQRGFFSIKIRDIT